MSEQEKQELKTLLKCILESTAIGLGFAWLYHIYRGIFG